VTAWPRDHRFFHFNRSSLRIPGIVVVAVIAGLAGVGIPVPLVAAVAVLVDRFIPAGPLVPGLIAPGALITGLVMAGVLVTGFVVEFLAGSPFMVIRLVLPGVLGLLGATGPLGGLVVTGIGVVAVPAFFIFIGRRPFLIQPFQFLFFLFRLFGLQHRHFHGEVDLRPSLVP